jgi:hypothetical protein
MTTASTAQRIAKGREKYLELRDVCWPGLSEKLLWNRKRHKGFTSIPRTLPNLINIIDSLTKNKPAGQTYLVLWARSYDEAMLTIDNPATLAAEAGFTGERAVSTWTQRMRALQELGFINAVEGPAGGFHYVLLLNPHQVVWSLKPTIQTSLFRQLHERALAIGATDMKPLDVEIPADKPGKPGKPGKPKKVKKAAAVK